MSAPEVITPEVVDSPATSTDVERHAGGEAAEGGVVAAIDRAAEAALANPGVPGRDEFLSLAAQARMLSLSGAAPEAVRDNPHIAFHVAMVGRDLGISPSAALQLIDVIKTRGGYQLSLSPQLLNGQVRRLGLGAIQPVVQERDRCVARAVGPDGVVLGETEFTWEDARDAGLVGPRCMPGEHRAGSDGKCGCNQGYRTYPRRMMWWRAAGFCAADWFPEASLGLYSPEELGAVVDEEGRPLDPAQVALPPGYDDPQERRREQQTAGDRPADPYALWELQESIAALPEGLQQELRTAWAGEQSRLRGFPARRLPERLYRTARAMVNGFWGKATSAGVNRDTEIAAFRRDMAQRLVGWMATGVAGAQAPSAPETASDPVSAPTPPPEVPEAQGDPQGAPAEAASDDGPAVNWQPVLRELADEVKVAGEGVPHAVAQRIADEVKGLHHTRLNSELREALLAERFPPDSPVDLRRMAVCWLRLQTFKAAGVVPGGGE